jgi:hypothetical protein
MGYNIHFSYTTMMNVLTFLVGLMRSLTWRVNERHNIVLTPIKLSLLPSEHYETHMIKWQVCQFDDDYYVECGL